MTFQMFCTLKVIAMYCTSYHKGCSKIRHMGLNCSNIFMKEGPFRQITFLSHFLKLSNAFVHFLIFYKCIFCKNECDWGWGPYASREAHRYLGPNEHYGRLWTLKKSAEKKWILRKRLMWYLLQWGKRHEQDEPKNINC